MLPSPVLGIKGFVPARDVELSKTFYTQLSFTVNWGHPEIVELQLGFAGVILQLSIVVALKC